MKIRTEVGQIEPVVHNLVSFRQEESGCLPVRGDGAYQPAFQVIERLGLLVPAQGPVVQPYPTFHCTLLLRREFETLQFAESHIL